LHFKMTASWRCAFIAVIAACGQPSAPVAKVRTQSPAVTSPGRIELGMMMQLRFWTEDGRYAVFDRGPSTPEHWAHQGVNTIVDATTLTSFEIDRATQLAFAPDGQHLAALIRRELVVYDLATAEPIGKPSPVYDNLGFTPDRRLVWVERDGIEYRVHLRDLATGAERVLVGLPASPLPRYNEQIHERIELAYDARGHVMASTLEAIRVWENDAPQAVVAITGFVSAPSLSDDGLAYRHEIDGRGVFRHIDLVEHREPIELHHSRTCGTGELKDATPLLAHVCLALSGVVVSSMYRTDTSRR